MKDEKAKLWLWKNRSDCHDAISTLEAAKRQSASAYDARLRKLNAFEEVIRVKLSDSGQLEMFDQSDILNAEIEELLRAPLGGL